MGAQYENGGWPHYYPIRKGYYQHITYNDGAMVGVMRLLRDVAQEKDPYVFVDQARRDRADIAIQKGLDVILQTQISVNGELTAWCAQHNRETLAPAKARAYELPSISGGEGAGIIIYLMEIDTPDDRVVRAVESAVVWYERSKITGVALIRKKDAPAIASVSRSNRRSGNEHHITTPVLVALFALSEGHFLYKKSNDRNLTQ